MVTWEIEKINKDNDDCHVWALVRDDRCEAIEFLDDLYRGNRKAWIKFRQRFLSLSRLGFKNDNDRIFKYLGEDLYEIKYSGGCRLYGFIEDNGNLFLLTNGGTKNTKKQQSNDIKRARKILKEYKNSTRGVKR